jgi:hypothetical protein
MNVCKKVLTAILILLLSSINNFVQAQETELSTIKTIPLNHQGNRGIEKKVYPEWGYYKRIISMNCCL